MAQTDNASPAKGFAAWQALTKALFDDYRPELHYMRGPGPKWHENTICRRLPARLRP